LLKQFLGDNIEGVVSRQADFEIPSGLTREALETYKRVAQAMIDAEKDSSGIQAGRIELVERALEQLK
jgi:hypothetical protein